MGIAENKARYEQSVVKVLIDANPDHQICDRCYCCDAVWETSPCWQCGGFEPEPDDGFDDTCSVCGGDGELTYRVCIGGCDEEGDHRRAGKEG